MTAISTDRVKCNPQLGRMPTLQFCRPSELHIDPGYQRNVQTSVSQRLIRRIAQFWNWDLCQPLTVARRQSLTMQLYVIDGQHRLAAARLRGDIDQLPCVIVDCESAAQEAASFVHLNQSRKPLSGLDLFRAAVASGDSTCTAMLEAMTAAGLSLAPHGNVASWKPGQVAAIGGLRAAWRYLGPEIAGAALRVIAQAWAGQVLTYFGTVFPGVVAVCDDLNQTGDLAEPGLERLQTLLVTRGQREWRDAMMAARSENPNLRYGSASALVLRRAWRGSLPPVAAPPPPAPAPAPVRFSPPAQWPRWCGQCERRVAEGDARACASAFCKAKVAA